MIKDYFILALRNLRKRKVRSWLTMIGIFVSIATIFVLISLSVGLQGAIQEQFRLLGTDKFFVMSKAQMGTGGSGPADLTTGDVDVIEKVSGVKQISYGTIGNGEVKYAEQTKYFMIVGIPLDNIDLYTEMGAFKADEGKLLDKGDIGKVMIGSDYKYNGIFKKPILAGDIITINGKEFKVKGIIAPIGNPSDDRNILMSIDDFKELFNSGNRVDQIIIQVDSGADVKEVADKTAKKLRNYRGQTEKTQDFFISTPEELLQSFGIILNILTAFLSGIAAISLLVGAIGITNTMYTATLERTKEIGVMKAIGAQNRDILLIFLIEAGLLGLVGGIIGVALGFGLSKLVEVIAVSYLGTNLLKAAAPIYLIVGCLVFSFLIGAVSGVWPAWRASKINTVDALRYE
ncbi:MAG: ABC transporter permease [Candidatus Pacearchaeota archaeon]|jgi:putative ABC transport system permease protein